MFTTSSRFSHSIVHSHDVAVLCEVVDARNQYVVTTLDVIGGSVSADATRKTRRQCTLTLQDPRSEFVPDDANDLLQPYSGYYIKLYRGIAWRDGTRELIPLGTFAPYAPKITDSGDSLEISISGYDRSKIISRARWVTPYIIPDGTNTGTAVRALIADRMADVRYNFQPTNATVPLTSLGVEPDHDPWEEATKLAESDGLELFFDARDNAVLRTIPDVEKNQVVHTFDDGDQCTVTQFERTNDASQMYTGVIVKAEGSTVNAPIRVEVWRTDTDLRIPYFYTTPLVLTEAQALSTAQSLLRRVGQLEISVDVQAIPDPRFEVGDVVRVTRAKSKLDDVFIVSSIELPLDSSGDMGISLAQRRAE